MKRNRRSLEQNLNWLKAVDPWPARGLSSQFGRTEVIHPLFQVISGVIVAIGVWAFNEKNRFRNLASGDEFDVYNIIFDFTIFMVIIGLVIFTVAFMGCIGALRENVLLLKIVSRDTAAITCAMSMHS